MRGMESGGRLQCFSAVYLFGAWEAGCFTEVAVLYIDLYRRVSLYWLYSAGTATVPTRIHETSSPVPTDSVETPPSSLVDHKTIDVTMLAATIFVAVLVLLTIVVVVIILLVSVFMLHCWQPRDSASAKAKRCGPEVGFGKETPSLKMC